MMTFPQKTESGAPSFSFLSSPRDSWGLWTVFSKYSEIARPLLAKPALYQQHFHSCLLGLPVTEPRPCQEHDLIHGIWLGSRNKTQMSVGDTPNLE